MGSIEPVGVVVVHTNLGGATVWRWTSSGWCGVLSIEETHPTTKSNGITLSSRTLATPQVSAGFDVNAQFRSVMNELGLSPEDTGGTITFVGEDPIFPSVHRLGDELLSTRANGEGERMYSRWQPQLTVL
jgi:hypothetical protein